MKESNEYAQEKRLQRNRKQHTPVAPCIWRGLQGHGNNKKQDVRKASRRSSCVEVVQLGGVVVSYIMIMIASIITLGEIM